MTDKRAVQHTYMPGLDGLRALAVFAVIGFHLDLPFVPGGFLGVTLFFVLSGYLITDILLTEWSQRSKIGLKDFFARRAKRLVPATLFVIVGLTAYISAFRPDLLSNLKSATLPAALFYSNWWYTFNGIPYFSYSITPSLFNHFWSLAIEAQFYMIWPFLLIALQRFVKIKWLKTTLVFLAAVASAVLMAILFKPGFDPGRVYYGTDTRVFSLLLGAALAFVMPSRRFAQAALKKAGRVVLDVAGFIALGAIIFSVYYVTQFDDFLYYGGMFLFSGASVVLIAAAVHPATVIGRIFGIRPLKFIGNISYGIYLWQFPIIAITNSVFQSGSLNVLLILGQVAATILLATFSYYVVETPLRRMKIMETLRTWFVRGRRTQLWKKAAQSVVAALVLVAGVGLLVVKPADTGLDTELLAQPEEISSDTVIEDIEEDDPPLVSQTPDASPSPSAAGYLYDASQSHDEASGESKTSSSPEASGSVGGDEISGSAISSSGDASAVSSPNPPDTADPPQESAPPEDVPSQQRVTLIGDSVGIDVTPYLKQLYPKLNAEAKEGRQFYEAKTIVRQLIDSEKLAPTVVFVLGSNGLIKESLLHELVEMIGPDRSIVFVNTQVPRSWCEGVNTMLTGVCDQYRNAIIADWYACSIGKDDYFYSDNVHPNPTGSKAMAQVISDAINEVQWPTPEEIAAAIAPF